MKFKTDVSTGDISYETIQEINDRRMARGLMPLNRFQVNNAFVNRPRHWDDSCFETFIVAYALLAGSSGGDISENQDQSYSGGSSESSSTEVENEE